MSHHIDVIATTISGSVQDWGKVKRIVPLFQQFREEDVTLSSVDRHIDARQKACELVASGSRIIISAGGSGTFNSVLEGCYDAQTDLRDLRLGFLRKGSADLLGKTLGMPDEIEEAIKVFVDSIRSDRFVPCDVLLARSGEGDVAPRHFVGYGGAEIFGAIPHYTENRFIKYYKGFLSQFFGDLGPFFVGTNLAILEKMLKRPFTKKNQWNIVIAGQPAAQGAYQAMIIVNGDLGPDLPFAKSKPLGSGQFYLFTLRDLGMFRLFGQLKHAWDSSILKNPQRWGFESYDIEKSLEISPDDQNTFPLNVDGSILYCQPSASIELVDQLKLISHK